MKFRRETLRGLVSIDYARVSSKPQIKKYGLRNQQRVRDKNTRELGLRRCSTIIDKGCTGRDFDRPGLDKLIQDVRKYNAKVINTFTINRLGRVAYKLVALIDRLVDLGVVAIVTKDGPYFLNDPRGRKAIVDEAVESESRWEELMQNTQGGKLAALDEGRFPFRPSFGMEKKDPNSMPVYKEGYVSIIRDVFELLVEYGREARDTTKPVFSRVAREINRRYRLMLPQIFAARKTKEFTGMDISRIVRNRIYNGWICIGGRGYREVKELKIVGDRLFSRAQEVVKMVASKYRTNDPGEVYPDRLVLDRSLRYAEDAVGDGLLVVLCPHCRSLPRRNGSEVIDGLPFRKFRCGECGYEYVVDLGDKVIDTYRLRELRCLWCGDYENFETRRIDSRYFKYLYACKSCGVEFACNFHPDKGRRRPSQSQRKCNLGFRRTEYRGVTLDDFM